MKFLVAMGAGEVRDSFFTPRVLKELAKLGEVKFNETGAQNMSKEILIEHIEGILQIYYG